MRAFVPDPLPDKPTNCSGCGRRMPTENIDRYHPTASGTGVLYMGLECRGRQI